MADRLMPPRTFLLLPLLLIASCALAPAATPWQAHGGGLKVSENRHFLTYTDGAPFFYLGDTAWEIFHRLKREDVDLYLTDRSKKGYTVIQAVALAEFDGLHGANAYGFRPLIGDDPTKPDLHDGPDNDYWDHVDYVVHKAGELGLVVGFLPTWADKWNKKWGEGPEIFTPANAAVYGEWLGRRYHDQPVIWILGGDRLPETDAQKEIERSLAHGLRKGDGGAHLITYHPQGGSGSADWAHNEDWLDFNMRQNGHGIEFTGRYESTRLDYNRRPAKPVIDAEPVYEDHPVNFKPKELGYSTAADCRRALYWDLFGGACGHTYGNHAVWQFWDKGRQPVNGPLMIWPEAINQPGAAQMQYGRKLIESRPVLSRVPDDSLITAWEVAMAMPGAGTRHFSATRDEAGSYAMVYLPIGRPVTVKTGQLRGEKLRGWWYDPRTGEAKAIGEFAKAPEQTFPAPAPGEQLDWVLVLDDAAAGYPPPGVASK